jgi:molecular chaperone GrpE
MKHKEHEHTTDAAEATDDAVSTATEDTQTEDSGTIPEAEAAECVAGESDTETTIRELTEQCTAMNDKYMRLMAEFDNYKRRSVKEYERLVDSASERLMKDIVEVRDNFERGFKSNDTGEKFAEGMKLIFSKFNSILHKHGLEIYGETGQEFNPELHDALMRTPHDEIAEGHIVDVHERGYKLKGKIIKHARVVVSSGKTETETSNN